MNLLTMASRPIKAAANARYLVRGAVILIIAFTLPVCGAERAEATVSRGLLEISGTKTPYLVQYLVPGSAFLSIHGLTFDRDDCPIEGKWCVRTEIVASTDEIVVMKATIAIEGCVVGTGFAEEIRGSSNINKTSALENCETSAIGRALAACGYAGEEYASANEVTNAIQSENDLKDAIAQHIITIKLIKEGIECGDLKIAAENWFDTLDEDAKRTLWVAPRRGGPFTTEERKIIASTEFREAKGWRVDDHIRHH